MPEQLEAITEPFKPKRVRKSTKRPEVKAQVITKAMIGMTNQQIAKDLSIDPSTVRVILSSQDIQGHVEEARSSMVLAGDLRKSVTVLRQRLDKGSESAATTILRGFNVLRSGDSMTVNVQNNGSMSWMQIIEAKHEQDKRDRTTTNSAPSTNRPSIDHEST